MDDPEIEFAKRVIALEFATREQLQECVNIQCHYREKGREFSLAKVLLQKGYLDHQQLAIALQQIPKMANTEKQLAMNKMPAEFLQNFLVKSSTISGTESLKTSLDQTQTASAGQGEIPKQFGRYQIIEEIGSGGMGKVYRAYESTLQRYVALKVLYQTSTREKELLRFKREAQLMGRLKHAHIIQIHDSGRVNGRFFFTMELIEGESLKEFLRKDPPLPHLIRLLIRVAQAVHYAHEQGIIHRDLKPSNIMIDDKGEPRVMDFGLARKTEVEAGEEISQSQEVVGTPEYMSPEQTSGSGKEIDARSDIYSLGIILYIILTGQPPFRGDTLMNIIFQITSKEPTPPARINRLVSHDLEAICLKAIEREKSQRYQTAKDFAADLHAYLAGNPVQARRLTTWYRLQRWTRRNRVLAPLLALMIAGLVVAIGSAVYSWIEARDSELQLITAKHRAAAKEVEAFRLATSTSELADGINKAYSMIKRAWLHVALAKVDLENRNYTAATKKIELVVEGEEALSLSSLAEKIEKALMDLPSLEKKVEELEQQENSQEIEDKIREIRKSIGGIRGRIEQISTEAKYLQQVIKHMRYVISFAPYVISARSQEEWVPIYKEFPRRVATANISGRFEVLASRSTTIVWDRLHRKQILEFRHPKPNGYRYEVACFSKDDKLLALGLSEGDVELWHLGRSELLWKQKFPLIKEQKLDKPPVISILISPDSEYLFASTPNEYALWKVPEMDNPIEQGSKNSSVSFSPDGKWLAIGKHFKGASGTQPTTILQLPKFDPNEPQKITTTHTFDHPLLRIWSKALCFLPDSNVLLNSLNGDFSIFSVYITKKGMDYYLKETWSLAHHGDLWDIAADIDNGLIASSGRDGKTILWDSSTYQKMCEFQDDSAKTFRSLRFFAKQKKLMMKDDSGLVEYSLHPKTLHKTFRLVDRQDVDYRHKNLAILEEVAKQSATSRTHRQFAVVQSPRQNLIAFYFYPNVFIWDWREDRVKLLQRYIFDELYDMTFSDNGEFLFCHTRKFIDCWQLSNLQATGRLSGTCRLISANLFLKVTKDGENQLYRNRQGHFEREASVAFQNRVDCTFYDEKTGILTATNGTIIERWQMQFPAKPRFISSTTERTPRLEISNIRALLTEGDIGIWGTEQGKIVWYDWQKQKILDELNLGDSVKNIRYDAQRKIYWIQTANYLFIYPKFALQNSNKSASIYPLRLFAGYPIRASCIDKDFRYITLALQDSQVMFLEIPE